MWKRLHALSGRSPRPPTHDDPEAEAEQLAISFADRANPAQLPPSTREQLPRAHRQRQQVIADHSLLPADTDCPITKDGLYATFR